MDKFEDEAVLLPEDISTRAQTKYFMSVHKFRSKHQS